jgi:hypothetical protein
MTNTKWYNETAGRGRGTDPNKGKVIIDVGVYDEDRIIEYICPWCNFVLCVRKSRKEVNCPNCTINLDLTSGVAQETKTLIDPNRSSATDEVHAFTTPPPINPWDKKPPTLKDGALALSKKGTIRFTSYYDSSAGKENAD